MMKKLIFKFITKYFVKELESFHDSKLKSELSSIQKELRSDDRAKALFINYPIGTKVIVRSNEPGPLLIGLIHGYENMHGKHYLLIEDEITKEIIMTFDSEPMIYKKEREEALSKLNWAEQYNVMSKFQYSIPLDTQLEKEDIGYLEQTRNKKFNKEEQDKKIFLALTKKVS